MINPSIYNYIKEEENAFETDEIQLGDNWYWNFRNHVQLIFHLKNGIFYTGENQWLRAFKNIMSPLLELSYWTEDIEVKDVVFFIENKVGRALSFLVKKYHDEVYTREHDLDTLFDEITESDLDYGGVLVQKTNKGKPEVLPLNTVAFCDQTDILGGAIAFKHTFAPSKLRQMSKFGWGKKENGATISIEELITIATDTKDPVGTLNEKKNKVPSKVIETYIVHGDLPEHYLKDNENMDDFYSQIHIVGFYTNKENKKEGVTLYRKKSDEGTIKFFTSKEVNGRALGRGVGETLLHQQIWTNFLTIHKMNMLEAGSKVPLYTDDPNYQNRNKIQDMENLEITTIQEDKRIFQVPTVAPANIQLFERTIDEWYAHAQLSSSAQDPILGAQPVSGTTFRGQERTVAQGKGLHDRRRGQRAKFIEEIYRDWIIPDILKEISKGKQFLATLTAEELMWVQDQLAINYVNQKTLEAVTSWKFITKEDQEQMLQLYKQGFAKKGNKHLLEILQDEFDDIEIKIGINIAGKQKDLANLSDKLLSIFQYIFQNPQGFQQAMQIPALASSFNDILEFSGMNQADFMSLTQPIPQGQMGTESSEQPRQPQEPMMAQA